MLRKAFVLLLALPMLLPPGFCVCRLEAFAPRPADRGSEAATVRQDTRLLRTCGCGNPNCRQRREAARAVQKKTDLSGAGALPDSPVERDRASTCPGNCPANPSYGISRAPHVQAATHLPDLFSVGLCLEASVPSAPACAFSAAAEFSSPPQAHAPIYLLFCDFRC